MQRETMNTKVFLQTAHLFEVGSRYIEVVGTFGIMFRFDRETKECVYSNMKLEAVDLPAITKFAFNS